MTSSPKRLWFRFHLLTAVLMMVAAGLAMSLSFQQRPYYADDWSPTAYDAKQTIGTAQGWPLAFHVTDNIDFGDGEIIVLPVSKWNYGSLAVDIFALFPVLAAVALISEFLIRRREGRKP